MKKIKTIYVAYGSNFNINQMAHRCPGAKIIGACKIEGYKLEFRGAVGFSYATIAPELGKYVPGLLWELTEADEAALDKYEGFPNHYYKEWILVKYRNKEVLAMVYIMSEGRKINPPSTEYYNTIRVGLIENNLKTNLLEKALDETFKEYMKRYYKL